MLFTILILCFLTAGSLMPASVSLKISGEGAVNDSTIQAGKPVSVDIYFENDSVWAGFTLGFAIKSPDIKTITHVVDSGMGINDRGDVKGFNGWENKSIWDLAGIFVVESDWDGTLPELLGLGGVCVKQRYHPHEWQKNMSFDIIVNEPGTLVVDSAFFPPGGNWLFSPPAHEPVWDGPFQYKVVK